MSKCITLKIKSQKFYLKRNLLTLENFSPRNILLYDSVCGCSETKIYSESGDLDYLGN